MHIKLKAQDSGKPQNIEQLCTQPNQRRSQIQFHNRLPLNNAKHKSGLSLRNFLSHRRLLTLSLVKINVCFAFASFPKRKHLIWNVFAPPRSFNSIDVLPKRYTRGERFRKIYLIRLLMLPLRTMAICTQQIDMEENWANKKRPFSFFFSLCV